MQQSFVIAAGGDGADTDGRVVVPMVPVGFVDGEWPFAGTASERQLAPVTEVPLIPYHQWRNHGPSTMRVWMPVSTSGENAG